MAKRLKAMKINETSGAYHPAHLAPGWIVMKSADEDLDAEIRKVLDELKAGDPGKEEPMSKSVEEQLAEVQAALKAAEERADKAEKALKATDPPKEPTEEEALAKAMQELPEPIRKAWEADRAKIAEAERVAKAERDARLSREYLEKAKDFTGLATKPEEFATVLRSIDELPEAAAKELHRVLRAADEAVHQAGLTKEIGGYGSDAGDAMRQLETIAAELVKADPSLSAPEALTKAMDANPKLVAQHYDEAGIARGGV